MDRWGDKIVSFVLLTSERLKEVATSTLTKDTPLEKALKEATSDKNWGCPTTLLYELAHHTHFYNDFYVIMKHVWEAISDVPKRWRRVYKGLTLLEYLLKSGSDRVVEGVRENHVHLKNLEEFRFFEDNRDKGFGIREKARIVCNLAFDPDLLQKEREKAKKNKGKFVGIGSGGEISTLSKYSGSFSTEATAVRTKISSNPVFNCTSNVGEGITSGVGSKVRIEQETVKATQETPRNNQKKKCYHKETIANEARIIHGRNAESCSSSDDSGSDPVRRRNCKKNTSEDNRDLLDLGSNNIALDKTKAFTTDQEKDLFEEECSWTDYKSVSHYSASSPHLDLFDNYNNSSMKNNQCIAFSTFESANSLESFTVKTQEHPSLRNSYISGGNKLTGGMKTALVSPNFNEDIIAGNDSDGNNVISRTQFPEINCQGWIHYGNQVSP